MPNQASASSSEFRVTTLGDGTRICRVRQACVAFQEAQTAVVELTTRGDQAEARAIKAAFDRRDMSLLTLRSLPARSKVAVCAKLQVLAVLRDWLGSADQDLHDFAVEIASEAVALLDHAGSEPCCAEMTMRQSYPGKAKIFPFFGQVSSWFGMEARGR